MSVLSFSFGALVDRVVNFAFLRGGRSGLPNHTDFNLYIQQGAWTSDSLTNNPTGVATQCNIFVEEHANAINQTAVSLDFGVTYTRVSYNTGTSWTPWKELIDQGSRPYSDTNPLIDSVASQGTSPRISRQDHVHPVITTTPTPPQFDADTSLVNSAFVQRALGNKQGQVTLADTDTTFTAADAGKNYLLGVSTTARLHTLPDISTVPIGATFELSNTSGFTATIRRFVGDGSTIVSTIDPSRTATQLNILHGLETKFVKESATSWHAHGTSDLAATNGAMKSNLTTTGGYQVLPSGLIVQWGYNIVLSSAVGDVTQLFPIPFPTAVVSRSVTPSGSTLPQIATFGPTSDNTGIAVSVWDPATGLRIPGLVVEYIAIGY